MIRRFTALIPLKGNSQRVPGKNLRELAGKPLFHWVCRALMATPEIDRIVIDTDSDEVEAAVRAFSPEIRILRRPEELQGDAVSVNTLIAWQLSVLDGDDYVQTHATSPLVRPETISSALAAFEDAGPHDSLYTVTRHQARMYCADGRPINHDPAELIETQRLPPVYEENSCLYVFTRKSFAKRKRRIGDSPLMFEIPHPDDVDIDTEDDFSLAAFWMARLKAA